MPNARGANIGVTTWLDVVGREARPRNGRWEYVDCPAGASTARAAAFAWRALNVSPEADERILGHATDPCHRIDIGRSARDLLMRQDDQPVAGTYAPLVRIDLVAEPATSAAASA